MAYHERDFLNGLAAGLTATAVNFNSFARIVYDIHVEEPGDVYVRIALDKGYVYVDWGDGSPIGIRGSIAPDEEVTLSHHFQSGNYTIALITDTQSHPIGRSYTTAPISSSSTDSGVYFVTDRTVYDATFGNVRYQLYNILRGAYLFGSVASIGNGAFRGCSALENVRIPDSVMSIGNYAFDRTALRSVIINRNATVGSYAFPSDCEISYY